MQRAQTWVLTVTLDQPFSFSVIQPESKYGALKGGLLQPPSKANVLGALHVLSLILFKHTL